MRIDRETLDPGTLLQQIERDLLACRDQTASLCHLVPDGRFDALRQRVVDAHDAAYQAVQRQDHPD